MSRNQAKPYWDAPALTAFPLFSVAGPHHIFAASGEKVVAVESGVPFGEIEHGGRQGAGRENVGQIVVPID